MRKPRIDWDRLLRRADEGLLGLVYPDAAVCLICGRAAEGQLLCADCRAGLDACRIEDGDTPAVWHYEAEAGTLVRMLKERAVGPAADVLAEGMAEKLSGMRVPPDTVITSVPMPGRRLRLRGVDHGRLLAEALGRKTGLPARPLLKRKAADARTQRGLSAEERRINVRGAFAAACAAPRCVLLVDDVLTTGATLDSCREALEAAGCAQVLFLTAARADPGRADDTAKEGSKHAKMDRSADPPADPDGGAGDRAGGEGC